MKYNVVFAAKDFARVISAGRKFMNKKKGTSSSRSSMRRRRTAPGPICGPATATAPPGLKSRYSTPRAALLWPLSITRSSPPLPALM